MVTIKKCAYFQPVSASAVIKRKGRIVKVEK
jgi:hypothetical protein